jgi:hypothetical protein
MTFMKRNTSPSYSKNNLYFPFSFFYFSFQIIIVITVAIFQFLFFSLQSSSILQTMNCFKSYLAAKHKIETLPFFSISRFNELKAFFSNSSAFFFKAGEPNTSDHSRLW